MIKNIKGPKQDSTNHECLGPLMFLIMICAILFRLFDVLTHYLCYPV